MILNLVTILISCFSLIFLQTTGNRLAIITYTQQKKWHPLMPLENNGTLQKCHLTKPPVQIDKYETHKNGTVQMRNTLQKMLKGYPICQGLSYFWKEILKYDVWYRLKIMRSTLECYSWYSSVSIVVGLVSISSVSVVLQKTNKVGLRNHLCWVTFLGSCMFDKTSVLYVTLC